MKGGGRERESGHHDLAEMSVDDFFESGLVSSSDDESPTASATAHKKHSRVKKRLVLLAREGSMQRSYDWYEYVCLCSLGGCSEAS